MYSNITNRREMAKILYNGQSICLSGAVSNNATVCVFGYPLSIKPSRIVFNNNNVNVQNEKIITISEYTINGDSLTVIMTDSATRGNPCVINVTLYYD